MRFPTAIAYFVAFLALMGIAAPGFAATKMPVRASHEPITAQASTPWGWVDFCQRYTTECGGDVLKAVDIELSARNWALIDHVNERVNHAIRPMSDLDHWGVVDQWDLPTDGYGDCEDYALLKRKLLMELGLPRQALLMTVVKDENGEGHAILTVKTDRGDFILDNMHDAIKAWDATGYTFVKRQTQTDPNVWEQIGPPTAAPTMVSK